MVRLLLPLACLAAACSFAGGARALGLGAVQTPPVLGRSLDLALPIALGDGETLDAGCLDAEVHVGDSRLPDDRLALALRPGARPGEWLLQLRSGVALTEPVLTLAVTAGCPARVSRRYTLLAELPALTPAPMAAATAAAAAAGGTGSPRIARDDSTASPAASATAGAAPRQGHASTRAAAAVRPPARIASRPPGAPVPPPSVDARPRLVEPTTGTSEVTASGTAPQPVATEASLARPRADRAVPAAPSVRAGGRDDTGRAGVPLVAVLAAGAGAAAALAWRRRRAATIGNAPPAAPLQLALASSTVEAASPVPATPVPVASVPVASVPVASVPVASGPAPVAPIVERAPASLAVNDVVVADAAPGSRGAYTRAAATTNAMPLLDLSLDEQIDLEQQVDFFVVLGRDDAAVDLLHEQLRRSGGRTPLAWLKLLEIHRRGGDRERYEATASGFGEAFGVVVPGWDAVGPRRGLADDAPRLAALQRCWSRPSDAMACLDALLHRRDDPNGRLDLGTFDDALLLYRIARDLHERGADERGGVDLLRPDDGERRLERGRAAVARRDAAPARRDLGPALSFELDFDRVAEESGREALVVR